jgi:hypothetical protein
MERTRSDNTRPLAAKAAAVLGKDCYGAATDSWRWLAPGFP